MVIADLLIFFYFKKFFSKGEFSFTSQKKEEVKDHKTKKKQSNETRGGFMIFLNIGMRILIRLRRQ